MALSTEAWRGAEICRRLAENIYFDLPGPIINFHQDFVAGMHNNFFQGQIGYGTKLLFQLFQDSLLSKQ
jgi:hypothetical protein